jgi:ComF family protein
MQIFRPIKKLSQAFLHIVMPPTCISCADIVEIQGQICGKCWGEIKFIGKHKCHACGLPFEFDMGKGAYCQHCLAHKPVFKKLRAVCKYDGIGRQLAARLKFHDKTHLAGSMAQMMFNAGGEVLKYADIIAPIPLHRTRKFFRKYNQSALLAQELAKKTKDSVDYQPNLLKRIRATTPQTKLNYAQRQKNVADAFAVHGDVRGKTILLIDDVMTTGATMNACARALKAAGAKRVNGLVFARVTVN